MAKKMDRLAIVRQLKLLDLYCEESNVHLKLTLFGGAAIILHLGDDKFRRTMDIDYRLEAADNKEKVDDILKKLSSVLQNMGGFPFYPDQELYMEDAEELTILENMPFTNITIFLPSKEMVVLSKVTTNREKDLIDLKESPLLNACNMERLVNLIVECMGYMSRAEFNRSNLKDWADILEARGIDYIALE